MSDQITLTEALSAKDVATLKVVLDAILPADTVRNMPSAGEDDIADKIAGEIRAERVGLVKAGLAGLVERARSKHGAALEELESAQVVDLYTECESSNSTFYQTLSAVAIQRYYQNPKVMVGLGMDPRPPYPKGFEVPRGDFSLLDQVKKRDKIYRPTE